MALPLISPVAALGLACCAGGVAVRINQRRPARGAANNDVAAPRVVTFE